MVKCHQIVNLKKWILSGQQENIMDFEYCEEYLRSSYIKQNIMTVLRKTNSHSVAIFRLIKNRYC